MPPAPGSLVALPAARCQQPDRRSPGVACLAGPRADPGIVARMRAINGHRFPARITRGTARQAGESGWRVPAAVHAPRYQLPDRDAEDRREPDELVHREAALAIAAVALGRAHGGRLRPAHQLTQRLLRPASAQPQGTDVRPDDNAPFIGHLPDGAALDAAHSGTRPMLRGRHSRHGAQASIDTDAPLMMLPPPRTRQHRETEQGQAGGPFPFALPPE